jgi:hypothetical protein
MEVDYFSRKKSSSGEYYYINKITGTTQWGFNTYFNTKKRLPKGWIRLNLYGKPVYKYIRDKKVVDSSYAYAPKEFRELEIFQMSYEELDEDQQAEACRRINLFENVARLLKLKMDSICDESLEYLAEKAKISPQTIIEYIQTTERKQLGRKAFLTLFSTIKRNDSSFSSERSIRELCGVNMREEEASKAQNQIDEELSCHITRELFKDPVMCSSGHTFERDAITIWLQTNKTCPETRLRITNYIVPNYALRKVLEKFAEKYKNQRGDIWKPIVELCLEYENFTGRLNAPEYVQVPETGSDESDRDESDTELDMDQQYRDMRERYTEIEIEENQTGRSEEEIRAYMIYYGNLNEVDIPEFIAQSSNSSYAHAIRESSLRYNQRGRTREQIRAYMINKGRGIEFIEDIPEFIAESRESSYRGTDLEVNRRYAELQRRIP